MLNIETKDINVYEKVSTMRRTTVKKQWPAQENWHLLLKISLSGYKITSSTFDLWSKCWNICIIKWIVMLLLIEISKDEEMFGNQLEVKLYPVVLSIWLIIMPSELFLKFKKNTDTFCFVLNCRTIFKLTSVESMKICECYE